jgi:LmbE family N-acetylglucosaminyl deacetylase
MTVLVVAAHPDDETLGCGGTIAKLARDGANVCVAILGEGITSRYDDPARVDPSEIVDLQAQSSEALDLLGVSEAFMSGLPDNRFDTVPLLEVVKILEDLIDRLEPEAIYTQHGGDLNVDHDVTFRATLTAARPLPESPVRRIYAYEVPSSTEWGPYRGSRAFRPNVFVDISDTLDVKLAAMERYQSETRPFPHPRSPEGIRSLATWRGVTAGLAAAEAFELIRSVER